MIYRRQETRTNPLDAEPTRALCNALFDLGKYGAPVDYIALPYFTRGEIAAYELGRAARD